MAAAELFRALGDPIRLEMVRRLSSGTGHTITSVSNGLLITRQGARKHLQVLADAKVVTLEVRGRDTAVLLEPEAFDQARAFIADLERRWDRRLEALRHFVDDEDANEGSSG